MEITLKHTGTHSNGASKTIDLNIKITDHRSISYEITNRLDGTIDESLIQQLESIVSGLKQQNELIKNS